MRKLNPEYTQAVIAAANQSPFVRLMSMQVKNFSIGSSLVHIDLQEKHLQPFGIVHGGVIAAIIDAAAFWAVYPEIDENLGMISVDLKVNYLAPIAAGKLVAVGKRIKIGRTIGLGEAEVTNENGKLLAHGTSTVFVSREIALKGSDPLPAKFLGGHEEHR